MPQPVHTSPKRHLHKEKPTIQEKGKLIDLEPKEDVKEIPMDEEDIDMGVDDVDVEGSTLSITCPSTFLSAEARERF